MFQRIVIAILGITIGLTGGYLIVLLSTPKTSKKIQQNIFAPQKKEVVGFLPFWLIDKADKDYSPFITTLSYFNLNIDSDGTIKRLDNQIEADPGWHALTGGKVDDIFTKARANQEKLSLTMFASDIDIINSILSDPVTNAQNLVNDVSPVMQKYGFSDLNIDIEQIPDASPEAQIKYSQFISNVKNNLTTRDLGTLTVDVSPIAFVRNKNLIDPKLISQYVDYIVLMAYDFHNPGSIVTGPVSPVTGAGKVSEFDTETAVQKALEIFPASKIILGIPLYGYSWESIDNFPRAAVVPSTAIIISNRTVEDLLAGCATCSAEYDVTDKESHIIYKNTDTGTFQQIFYPDQKATQDKVKIANDYNLGGMALWALGYEGNTILQPLAGYHH